MLSPAAPNLPHGPTHRAMGRFTMWATIGTAIAGWIFYRCAFVAK
jgi:hypothetical protein